MRLPKARRWLFWEHDFARLDTERDEITVLARVLEHGCMADVRWAIATYGRARIHRFLRDVGHPELAPRTIAFWRAVFRAEDETWASAPAWRRDNSVPWLD